MPADHVIPLHFPGAVREAELVAEQLAHIATLTPAQAERYSLRLQTEIARLWRAT